MPKWTKIDVTVVGRQLGRPATWSTRGYATIACAGLAITPDGNRDCWSITHLTSGLAIPPRAATLPLAKRLLLAWAPIADWTRSADDLWADLAFIGEAAKLRAQLEVSGDYLSFDPSPAAGQPKAVADIVQGAITIARQEASRHASA